MNPEGHEFLMRLLETPSPVGEEERAATVWRAEAEGFADEVRRDPIGNSYARLRGAGPRVVIEAHIDEIGLLVVNIDEDGFCWLAPIGIWDPEVLVGQRVRVLGRSGDLVGVIGRAPAHQLIAEGADRRVRVDELWLDIGATSRAEAEETVAIGDRAVLDQPPFMIGADRLVGRGLDDRVGAWAALEVLRRLAGSARPSLDIWAVACVQEEIGCRGASAAAHELNPTVAICIDVWHSSDHPAGTPRIYGECRLGGGPVLHRSPALSPALHDAIVAVARSESIPHAIRAIPSADDAAEFARFGRGAATEVGIPCRYMHSGSEIVSLSDLSLTVRLCATVLRCIDPAALPGAP